ncbi:MAG: hypothetical protein OXE96_08415 [Gemmatimonadetes bacterium]|nr:hypothetical protein [Gemmatimonadota bacterium]
MVACKRVVSGRGVLYCSRACVVANKVLNYEPPPGRTYDAQDVVERLVAALAERGSTGAATFAGQQLEDRDPSR